MNFISVSGYTHTHTHRGKTAKHYTFTSGSGKSACIGSSALPGCPLLHSPPPSYTPLLGFLTFRLAWQARLLRMLPLTLTSSLNIPNRFLENLSLYSLMLGAISGALLERPINSIRLLPNSTLKVHCLLPSKPPKHHQVPRVPTTEKHTQSLAAIKTIE